MFGVSKFYEFSFGHKFILQTDNGGISKNIRTKIWHTKNGSKTITILVNFLSGFKYEIQHIKSKNNPADYLSRVSINSQDKLRNCEIIDKSFECNTINYIMKSDLKALNWQTVQNETKKDKILCNIIRYCRDGWPVKNNLGEDYEPYFRKRNEISAEKECLLWGYRLIIPLNLRDNVICELHASHLGITRMKQKIEDHIFGGLVWIMK